MKITVADVIAITGGQVLQNGTNDSFNGVSIDSRQTTIGRLFVALRGQKTDGHFFLPDAKTRGAAGALIDHSVPILPDFPLFLVKDTGKALVELGTGISRRLAGTKIAFTGTVGKTTTKWFFQTLLSRKYRVDGTPQSFNTAIGISTSLCNFDEKSEFFLIEAGVSHRGEMKDLVALIEPSIVIFT
ncbi:MAG: Mur ligase family protein, partial [Atribacterota bacterium]